MIMISTKSKFASFSSIISMILLISFLFLSSCNALKNDRAMKSDRPLQAEDKRRQNIKEGRGVSLGKVLGRGGNTNYEFSTSNPMWRASLEILDFLPLATVDYSGGIIITDWYAEDSSKQDSIKISLRFLSNDIRSESLKVIVHQKECTSSQNCVVSLLSSSKIKEELHSEILRRAALLEKESNKKN
mgnify:CR=1 FL=1